MQGKDTPRRPERVMAASSSSDTIENDTEKTKSAHKEKLVISDSDHIDRESEDVIKTEEAADAEEIPESGRIRRGSVHLVEEADDVEADVFVMDEDLNSTATKLIKFN